jgi:hypothetical protein
MFNNIFPLLTHIYFILLFLGYYPLRGLAMVFVHIMYGQRASARQIKTNSSDRTAKYDILGNRKMGLTAAVAF